MSVRLDVLIASLAFAAALGLAPVAVADPADDHPAPDHPGEQAVDPYTPSDANAGAAPTRDAGLFNAFHGKAGIGRIVDGLVDRSVADPRIAEIFKNQDLVRLRRTLKEQFCYLLGGGCVYTGRDMKTAHKDMGIQDADFNALVENLELAMTQEGVSNRAQNKLLAILAPMHRDMARQ
jgi:hemoglobin